MPTSAHRLRVVRNSDDDLLTNGDDHRDDSAAESRSNHRPFLASCSLCTEGGLGALAARFNERSSGTVIRISKCSALARNKFAHLSLGGQLRCAETVCACL